MPRVNPPHDSEKKAAEEAPQELLDDWLEDTEEGEHDPALD